MRRERGVDVRVRRQRVEPLPRMMYQAHRIWSVEPDQLVEYDGRQTAVAKEGHRHQRVADIAHEGRARGARLTNRVRRRSKDRRVRRIRVLTPALHDLTDPVDELRGGWNGVTQVRQLEVCVRVHEAWQHDGTPEIDHVAATAVVRPAERHD